MTPHVTCICLTADRQALTDRAVKCFLAQTYPEKHLLILDNGATPYDLERSATVTGAPVIRGIERDWANVTVVRLGQDKSKTVGALRNIAVGMALSADIIAHWDSDDWSHPLRLAWQMNALKNEQEPKLGLVGYRSMMFWRDGEAWEFSDQRLTYLIGTSFCYWRKSWEQQQFPEANKGEDNLWQKAFVRRGEIGFFKNEPAMIASILPDGAGGWYDDPGMLKSPNWTRTPDWDDKIRRLMT